MSEKKDTGGRIETRVVPVSSGRVEVRADEDGEPRGIQGRVNTYGTVTDLGPFTEEVAPGFFNDVGDHDVRGLFNHDSNMVLGRSKPDEPARTLELAPTDKGLDYAIPKMPKSRADVLEAIQRGDVDGNSFSFTMPAERRGEDWIDDGPHGKPHRILKRAERHFDVGPVTFPAYEEGTSVHSRSVGDVYREWRSATAVAEGPDTGTEPETDVDENVEPVEVDPALVDAVLAAIAAGQGTSDVEVEVEVEVDDDEADPIAVAKAKLALEEEAAA